MDRIRKKRRSSAKKKKVLLSIVDPWDVRVASVDGAAEEGGLSRRRGRLGLSIEPLDSISRSSSAAGSACGSPRTPWPWYKPAAAAAASHSASTIRLGDAAGGSGSGSSSNGAGSHVQERAAAAAAAADDTDVPIKRRRADEEKEAAGTNSKDNGQPSAAGTAAAPSRRLSDRSLIRGIVEELVRSRYNNVTRSGSGSGSGSRAALLSRRRKRLQPRIVPPRSINHTAGKNDGWVRGAAAEDDFLRENSRASQTSSQQHQEERPIDNTRKLSLSMPTKLDAMEDLRIGNEKGESLKFARRESDSSATFSNSGSTLNGSTLGSETEDENEEEASKVPLQPRGGQQAAASISPAANSANSARKMNNELDYPNVQSTNSTITSVNSISSLLKEKLQWTIPQALRSSKKRQNADYRLRGFVGFLFLCVVFLVGFAHIYYTQHVLQRTYFDKFRFNKNERLLRVYNSMGVEVIAARLGVGIPSDTGVFSCLAQDQRPGKVCLEWLHHSRLYIGHTTRGGGGGGGGGGDSINCYHVTWQALRPGVNPQDCFDWSAKRGHWYGVGQIPNTAYPLEQGRLQPASPFITGDIRRHPFGNVLKRYFVNSKGASLSVDPETPLYVSISAVNASQLHHRVGADASATASASATTSSSSSSKREKEMCLMAKHDAFAFVNHLTAEPQLNYSICTSDTSMRSLHALMAEKFMWDGLRPEELQAVHSLLTEPVWQVSPTNEADVYNYTEDVIALGFLRQGHVLLSEQWQPNSGDLVLDAERFRTMKETINIIHRRGFRIALALQPFVSTESRNFREAVDSRLLVGERGSADPRRVPALTRYGRANSAALLDITANATLPWLRAKLASLLEAYHVDAFYLDLGTAQDMPHYYSCERPLPNPDHYKSLFVEAIIEAGLPVIAVSSAIARPRAPVFVSLPAFPSSWKAIKTVIPTVLSYGISGYPFVMPGAVGGDLALLDNAGDDGDYEVHLPDKELYVRWLQLSTFLPVIRFTHLPSKYSDESVLEIAKSLTTLRQKHVTPRLKKYANVSLDTGLPIIRPLWMLDPADPACHLVVDEFSVGDEIIVAPILHSGSRQREVYLPAGVWKDGIDQSLRKGSRWLHQYRVAEDKIAYFIKMPADMRF